MTKRHGALSLYMSDRPTAHRRPPMPISENRAVLFDHEESLLRSMLHMHDWQNADRVADIQHHLGQYGNRNRQSTAATRGTLAQLVERGLVMRREASRDGSIRRPVQFAISPDGVRWLHRREDALKVAELHRRAEARRDEAVQAAHNVLADIVTWRDVEADPLRTRYGFLSLAAEQNISEHVHNMAWAASVGYEWPEHVVTLREAVA